MSLSLGSESDDHCAIHTIEGLVFARETIIVENGEPEHIVSQVDSADGESMERDLLIGQFGAYQNGSPETRDPSMQ